MSDHLIAILGFNKQDRVDRCAASVRETLPADLCENCDPILLDNGQTELTAPEGFRRIAAYPSSHGGFTAGFNVLLRGAGRYSEGPPATVTVLNDDLTVEPGCLAAMIAAAQEEGVGMAFPMQVSMSNPRVIICGGTGKAYPAGEHKTGIRGERWGKRERCRWMPFAAVTIAARTLELVGLLDDNMRLWFSDSDYCIRTRLAGLDLVYLGEGAVVRHEMSAAIRETMDDRGRWRQMAEDRCAFERKWSGTILAEYSV